jgi:hypothetical protein
MGGWRVVFSGFSGFCSTASHVDLSHRHVAAPPSLAGAAGAEEGTPEEAAAAPEPPNEQCAEPQRSQGERLLMIQEI